MALPVSWVGWLLFWCWEAGSRALALSCSPTPKTAFLRGSQTQLPLNYPAPKRQALWGRGHTWTDTLTQHMQRARAPGDCKAHLHPHPAVV